MRTLICSPGLFDQDRIKIMMKMSSLMKFRIIDHELCVCEYGLSARIHTSFPIMSSDILNIKVKSRSFNKIGILPI
jgi:hypothetical protein